jgi:lysophospholipase L1-like esterase
LGYAAGIMRAYTTDGSGETWRGDVRERKAMQTFLRGRHCRLSYLILAVTIASALATTCRRSSTRSSRNTAIEPVSNAGKATWMARHQAMNARAQQGHIDLIYVGDSIVEHYETRGKDTWDRYYAPRQAMNLGISGDRTEHVLWRLAHGNLDGIAPTLAIVMIGQNNGSQNTAEEIGAGVTAVVQKIRAKLPTTKLLLLAIFPRSAKPTKERAVLAKASAIAAELADNHTIFYMDINKIFLRPDGSIPAELMPDFEHPSAKGYRLWAEAIEPTVTALMGDKAIAPAAP